MVEVKRIPLQITLSLVVLLHANSPADHNGPICGLGVPMNHHLVIPSADQFQRHPMIGDVQIILARDGCTVVVDSPLDSEYSNLRPKAGGSTVPLYSGGCERISGHEVDRDGRLVRKDRQPQLGSDLLPRS